MSRNHRRRPHYYRLPGDDGSPDFVSCGVYVLVAGVLLGIVLFILFKAGGLI